MQIMRAAIIMWVVTLSINRTSNYTINIHSDNLVINTLMKTELVIITAFTCHHKQRRNSITTPSMVWHYGTIYSLVYGTGVSVALHAWPDVVALSGSWGKGGRGERERPGGRPGEQGNEVGERGTRRWNCIIERVSSRGMYSTVLG